MPIYPDVPPVRDTTQTIIRQAALALSPDAPNTALAHVIGCPKETARAYAKGRRRPSVAALERVREGLCQRARELWAMANCGGELDCEIQRRKKEPKQLRGCCARLSRVSGTEPHA